MNTFEIIAKLRVIFSQSRAEGWAKSELLEAIERFDDHIAALDIADSRYIQGYVQAQLDCNIDLCKSGFLSPDSPVLDFIWPNGNIYF